MVSRWVRAARVARSAAGVGRASGATKGAGGGCRAFASVAAPALASSRKWVGAAFLGAAGSLAAAGLGVSSMAEAKEAAVPETDYGKVREDLTALFDKDQSYGPLFVRLAWHCSGTYSKSSGTGGSNGGCMRFDPEASWGANAGLGKARALLEPVKAKHPGMTYADLYTLAGVQAIADMGGPKISWRPGRTDLEAGPSPNQDGTLPDADKGSLKATVQHLRDIFHRMGFNDREIVALSGAHSLGRCHADASGYVNPWTNAETTFSNEYFRLLVEERWTLKRWNGPDQFEDPSGNLMMLPSDMALMWDKDFRKVVDEYAKDYDVFAKDFASAFERLMELGVPAFQKKGLFGLW